MSSRPKHITHVVHISTDVGKSCEHCGERIGLDRFDESVNHFMEKHGYRILHVGQETGLDHEGKPFEKTVAVLGK